MEIKKEYKNPLFDRREVNLIVKSEITPSYKDTEKMIADKFSVDPESIKIKTINGKFGKKEFLIDANIYSSKEEKDKIERKPKEKKKK